MKTASDSELETGNRGDLSNPDSNAEAAIAAQQRVLLAPPQRSIGPDGKRRSGHPSGHSQAARRASQKFLYWFRNENHLSQKAMAVELGVELSTYQAWEYGKTQDAPAWAVRKVAGMKVDSMYGELIARYGGKSACDMARDWCRRMDIPDHQPVELARALGVNPSTTCRWLNPDGHVTIALDALVRYERRVRREERYLRSSNRRHPGWHERKDGAAASGQRRGNADEVPASTVLVPDPETA